MVSFLPRSKDRPSDVKKITLTQNKNSKKKHQFFECSEIKQVLYENLENKICSQIPFGIIYLLFMYMSQRGHHLSLVNLQIKFINHLHKFFFTGDVRRRK